MSKKSNRFSKNSGNNFLGRIKFMAGAAVAFAFAIGLIVFAKSGVYEEKKDAFFYVLHEASLSLDLRVEQILVKGRNRTPSKKVIKALNASVGMPILAVDLHKAKENISKLPWVKSVRIERRLPHTLLVVLTEREPIAVWQHKKNKETVYNPIDSEGNIVRENVKRLKDFPLIVGKNAPEKTPALLKFLKQEPVLYARVRAATLLGNRRWDITLDNISDGIVIKLPEKNPESEWSRLLRLDKTHGLLKRTVTMIDLRFPDKVIVQFEEIKKSKTKSSSMEISRETGI